MGISALSASNNLLYLLTSLLLGFMGASGFLGRRNLRLIEVSLEIPQEVYAQRQTPIRLIVRNRKRFLPSFLLQVEMHGKKLLIPYLDSRAETSCLVELIFPSRGRFEIGPVFISSVFPFSFFERRSVMDAKKELIVFPSPKPFTMPHLSQRERPARDEPSRWRGFEGDLLSIRDYTEGDPIKHIHWKQSAKTGVLKIKELSLATNRPSMIEFESVPAADTEERISFVTYLILMLVKKGVPVGLRIRGAIFPPSLSETHKRSLLRELALYEDSLGP